MSFHKASSFCMVEQQQNIAQRQRTHPSSSHHAQKRRRKGGGSAGPHGRGRRGSHGHTPLRAALVSQGGSQPVPPVAAKTLRIVPLGGQEEVGRNMTVFEYGDDIIIVDMGLQFPEEDMPGIDYIVPNTNYLVGKEKKIRGVVFTHGHLDHIGAAHILLEKLGNPPVIGRDLTLALMKRKLEDYKPQSAKQLQAIRVTSFDQPMRFGDLQLRFFEVEHSIMDAIGIAVESPVATAVHMGDWTLETGSTESGKHLSYEILSSFKRPTILMLESLGATSRKPLVTEEQMLANLTRIIDAAQGRVIVGTFSSQVKRVRDILEHAQNTGKKVAVDGYSMRMNIEAAKELGYIKVREETLIPISDIDRYPENKIVVVCTGAQGESRAVLNRIVTGNHKFIALKKSDTVIFSSSIIPGNERTVQRLKDNLYRKCDNVIHTDIMDIHVSGHSNIESIRAVLRQSKPDYFIPVYANHFFLKEAAKIAREEGMNDNKVLVLDNGHVADFGEKGPEVNKRKADTSYVFIDGLGIGDVGHVVLRDRQMLAEDGMYVITVIIDSSTKDVVGNIQVTSRGFIYVKENFDLVNETKRQVRDIIKTTTSRETSIDWKVVENAIRDRVGEFLFQKTERRPMEEKFSRSEEHTSE